MLLDPPIHHATFSLHSREGGSSSKKCCYVVVQKNEQTNEHLLLLLLRREDEDDDDVEQEVGCVGVGMVGQVCRITFVAHQQRPLTETLAENFFTLTKKLVEESEKDKNFSTDH